MVFSEPITYKKYFILHIFHILTLLNSSTQYIFLEMFMSLNFIPWALIFLRLHREIAATFWSFCVVILIPATVMIMLFVVTLATTAHLFHRVVHLVTTIYRKTKQSLMITIDSWDFTKQYRAADGGQPAVIRARKQLFSLSFLALVSFKISEVEHHLLSCNAYWNPKIDKSKITKNQSVHVTRYSQ